MEIIESWEDQNNNVYAIVRWSKKEPQGYNQKEYEAMWLGENNPPELCSFAGSVGYRIADFSTLEEAQDFLLKGISEVDNNPDTWFEMLAV